MDIQILPLSRSDIAQAVECIQTVFADDPFFQYMFDQNTVSRALSSGNPPYQHVIITLIMLLISIMMTMLMMIMIIMETV
jgi:hypothetical protein